MRAGSAPDPRRREQAEHNLLAAPGRAGPRRAAPRRAPRLAAPHDVRVTH
jgi:hypothetical protein